MQNTRKDLIMLGNYVKITARKLWKNRLHSIIHILGLTIGLTSCLLIFLYIKHEYSFDSFIKDSERIYRFTRDVQTPVSESSDAVMPYPFGKVAEEELSDLGTTTMIHYETESVVIVDDAKFEIENVIFADSSFFSVFNFPVLSGDPIQDLNKPTSAFITEKWAKILFKDKDPIGQSFSLNNDAEFEVAGIIGEAPGNTHLTYEMVVSYGAFNKDFIGGINPDWGATSQGFCYIKLNEGNTPTLIAPRLHEFHEKYYTNTDEIKGEIVLQPLSDIHFNQAYVSNNPGYTIDTSYLVSLGLIGILILVIACINFINLATAVAVKKAKEVGVRKTLGAEKWQIILQFLGEAFILTMISMILSIGLVERILPRFNNFLEREIPFNLFSDHTIILTVSLLVIVVTLLAGLYPSLTLARFNAIKVLKSKLTSPDKSGLIVRRGLVVFQFAIAQILIICAIVISSQMKYFNNKPLGFKKEHLVNVSIPNPTEKNISALEARLQGIPGINKLTFCVGAPSDDNNLGTSFSTPELAEKEHYNVAVKAADRRYLETYGIELIAGRWMTAAEEAQAIKPFEEKPSYVLVVNEALTSKLGYANPEDAIGQELFVGLNGMQAKIIGVVKNFHTTSLKAEIQPVILLNFPFFYYSAGIEINAENARETLDAIQAGWSEVFPDYLFEYTFLEDHIESLYEEETRLFTLIQVFSGLSIFIGGIGLIGLISFIIVQRMKEIGVRKVLGASVPRIIFGLANEFLILEVVAFLIAVPLSYYALDLWLNEFAYRITMNPLQFVSGLLLSLLIAGLTVGIQSYRAAAANPVDALKDE